MQFADTVHVRVGSGNVLTFPSRVERVAVGDERIVAIHVVEPRQVLLQGLMPGRSNVFVWLEGGRRLRYDLVVAPQFEALESALRALDPNIRIEPSGDGSVLILSGRVRDGRIAAEARSLTERLLGVAPGVTTSGRVVSLLEYPGLSDADLRLSTALLDVDPRIRPRRMQVGLDANSAVDAVVLEGRVRDISSLVRAITLAELQLGGIGGRIEPLDDKAFDVARNRNFAGTTGGGLQRLQGNEPPTAGLALHVARGQILKSASGRVLSFLEVDNLPQIMVSIRVLQIDRGRARRLGIDYRIDKDHLSIGSYHQPGQPGLPAAPNVPSVSNILTGNLVGSFVDRTLRIVAAIDLLQQQTVARSVAEPNITTLSGESASVLVGGEVPIPTTTLGQTASVQGFLFQDFGVRLDIRPTLAPNGLVALEISPSIIRPTADLAVSGVPGFQVQSVQTTASVAPGQSLVIGGLISFEEENSKRGVPGLSEVPILRNFFSWEGREISEQEILFVITPRLLTDPEEQLAAALEWRDVEPLAPGDVIQLPAFDNRPAQPGTLDQYGLPPSFQTSPPPPREIGMLQAPASVAVAAPMQPAAPASTWTSTSTQSNVPAAEARPASAAPSAVASPVRAPEPVPAAASVPSPAPSSVRAEEPDFVVTPAPVAAAPVKPATPAPAPEPVKVVEAKPVAAPAPVAAPVKPATPAPAPEPVKVVEAKPVVAPAPVATPVKPATPAPAPEPVKVVEAKPVVAPAPVAAPVKPATPAPAPEPVKVVEAKPVVAPAPVAAPVRPVTPAPAPEPAKVVEAKPAVAPAPVAAPVRPVTPAPAPEPAKVVEAKPAVTPAPVVTPSAPTPRPTRGVLASAQIDPQMRATLSTDHHIEVSVIPHDGDAWTRLAKRVTGDAKNWWAIADFNDAGEALVAGVPVRVPFHILRPQIQRQIAAELLPSGSELETAWKRANPELAEQVLSPSSVPAAGAPEKKGVPQSQWRPATASTLSTVDIDDQMRAVLTAAYDINVTFKPSAGDSWTRLALRLTGDAANWRAIAAANESTEKLTADAPVRVPFRLLRPELRDQVTKALIPPGSAREAEWQRVKSNPTVASAAAN
ncbi:MAG TPA: pilus assembly protein N-terminal domain-containing protein [Thermoanaerobaculia bacterium]